MCYFHNQVPHVLLSVLYFFFLLGNPMAELLEVIESLKKNTCP